MSAINLRMSLYFIVSLFQYLSLNKFSYFSFRTELVIYVIIIQKYKLLNICVFILMLQVEVEFRRFVHGIKSCIIFNNFKMNITNNMNIQYSSHLYKMFRLLTIGIQMIHKLVSFGALGVVSGGSQYSISFVSGGLGRFNRRDD